MMSPRASLRSLSMPPLSPSVQASLINAQPMEGPRRPFLPHTVTTDIIFPNGKTLLCGNISVCKWAWVELRLGGGGGGHYGLCHPANKITKITNFACSGPIGSKIGQRCGFLPEITNTKFELWVWMVNKFNISIYPLKLKTNMGYVLVNCIALQHLFMFNYKVDNNTYNFFCYPNQSNKAFACFLVAIQLSFMKEIVFLSVLWVRYICYFVTITNEFTICKTNV